MKVPSHFYPRPPRGGRRLPSQTFSLPLIFLSTPSARRATVDSGIFFCVFSISIHALREEGDMARMCKALERDEFLSTPSARRATKFHDYFTSALPISIHALREEGDRNRCRICNTNKHFYPRPPRGGRLQCMIDFIQLFEFLSTPSARRATADLGWSGQNMNISIHALREEGDSYQIALCGSTGRFLSTPSARRATAKTEKKSLLLFHYKSFCTKWKELQLCRTRKVRILWPKHPFFRCEENGKSMSACASHTEKSEDQRAVLLETGVKADVLDL